MKLAVNYSSALLSIIEANPKLPVDYIKVPTCPLPDSLAQFETGKTYRRLLPHPAQPGVLDLGNINPELRFNQALLIKIIAESNPTYLSTHLEARSEYFPDLQLYQHQYDRDVANALTERFLNSIAQVKSVTNLPLLIENFPYYTWGAHFRLASEPKFITEICEAGNCGLLLDIAHARCSAWHFDIPLQEYIENLPLGRVREIHLAGTELRKDEGMRDTHTALTEDDYRWLGILLDRTDPEVVTIEYGGLPERIRNRQREYEPIFRNNPVELERMILRVASVIGAKVK